MLRTGMPTLVPVVRRAEHTLGPHLPRYIERPYFSVCLAHRKGGVGKTTSTWYLGRELARAGKRVLLRDLDPQQGLTDIVRDLGGQDGVFSSRLALVPEGAPLPWVPHVELIDTPPSLDESLPGVNRADALIIPAVPAPGCTRPGTYVARDPSHAARAPVPAAPGHSAGAGATALGAPRRVSRCSSAPKFHHVSLTALLAACGVEPCG